MTSSPFSESREMTTWGFDETEHRHRNSGAIHFLHRDDFLAAGLSKCSVSMEPKASTAKLEILAE